MRLIERAWIILGLTGLAVAQPLLDLFGRNPEFFVAGDYTSGQIVWFALLITLVPPVVGIGAVALATLISDRAATFVFAVVVAVLSTALGLAVLRTIGVDRAAVVLVVGVAAGVALTILVLRTRGTRLLVSYLAVANLLFLGSFIVLSPTSKLVTDAAGAGDAGDVDVAAPSGPVVVVVLDEFPAATIMRADGTLNAERYPGFGELAAASTWFRNASSRHNLTHRAVPALLTGALGDDDALPIAADHPRNLFSLLGGVVPVHRYESVTDLCPPSICEPPPRQPLRQALEDASVVYGHRVLPTELRDQLPAIDNSWGAYGAETDVGSVSGGDGARPAEETQIERAYSRWLGMGADERSPRGQAQILREQIDAITGAPALHVVHVALPHRPWTLSPSGVSTSYEPEQITDPAAPGYDFRVRMEYQLHSLQVGAVDTLIGELVEKLRALRTWEDTLLVVTSDHGSNLTPPDLGRMTITDANREEAYRVPLFIKAPGEEGGNVRDDAAELIDVVPTIADLVGAETDWEFDGHSLYDASPARTAPLISTEVDAVLEIAARRAEEFPHGDDWTALAAVGELSGLVGTSITEVDLGRPSEYRVSLANPAQYDDLPTADGRAPFVVTGDVRAPAGSSGKPPELLIAVNGNIAGVAGGYRPSGTAWVFDGFVGDVYREGPNEVDLYEVTGTGELRLVG